MNMDKSNLFKQCLDMDRGADPSWFAVRSFSLHTCSWLQAINTPECKTW